MRNIIAALTLTAAMAGCAHIARDEAQYRDDTRSLLQGRNAQLKSCYDNALATDASASGTVTVHFVVEKKTGVVNSVEVDPAQTQAPTSLQTCVVKALDGLVLTPEDRHAGEATFSWTFRPGDAGLGESEPAL